MFWWKDNKRNVLVKGKQKNCGGGGGRGGEGGKIEMWDDLYTLNNSMDIHSCPHSSILGKELSVFCGGISLLWGRIL